MMFFSSSSFSSKKKYTKSCRGNKKRRRRRRQQLLPRRQFIRIYSRFFLVPGNILLTQNRLCIILSSQPQGSLAVSCAVDWQIGPRAAWKSVTSDARTGLKLSVKRGMDGFMVPNWR